MCKRENEGNEQQRELEVVFAQLVAIDRARNSAEVDLAVNTLLQAIGEYTQAERTYIFEMMEEERIFTNIYEWCSEGVTPQIDNLQALTADDMPVWYRIFLRGESIIIDDLETVKESMPLEYDILKAQDIYSEISFPIWYRGKLMGFIGVDNPRVAKSRYFLNLLAVVGGYVGNAWENFRVARQLKQNRDALQQNRRDLEKDYYDEISSQDELHRLTGKHGRASARMQEICDAFVASGYRENVRQFLDLTHIESGQMKAAHQEMQLTSFFAELCLLVDGICIGRSLRFEKCLHDIRYERIVADPVLLRQIYMNLLSNAVKYTSDGGTVTLEMYEEMLPGTNRIRLVSRVQDSGIGMSREYMDVMYAKFSRAVDTRVNQVRGSGLGLSVVKELTDLLGGQVHVESAPEGTYNAILMDMQMPVMDGVQATETIRHMTRRDAVTIPIIAMTANAFQQDVASCMNAGMNGHLAKPFDLAKLLPMLADACRRQVRTEK